ncbi:MAG: TIM-barrel domain-containing protein [Janthinobacterium lividum]
MFPATPRFARYLLSCAVLTPKRRASAVGIFALSCLAPLPSAGQIPGSDLIHLSNGLRAHAGEQTVEIITLREDVIRVRAWQGSAEPENSSWAVLPEALHSTATVTPEANGFSTGKVHVALGPGLALTVTDNAGNILQQDAEPMLRHGSSFRVYKQRTEEEHFFGLGDKPGPLDRSGEAFTMWNTDHFGWQESTDPIYKSIPFFLDMRQGRTLGVFFNNTYRSSFDFGRENASEYSFGSEDGPADYFLLYGPAPKAVLRSYAWLTGPTPLPPLWSLGFQQSRYSYSPESELVDVEHRLRADKIPADVLWLDIDFQKNNMPFTVDPDRFPNFPQLVKNLAADRFHLAVITDLHIARQPGIGYAPFDSGVAGDHFVKLPDGSTYVGVVWPGPAVFPEFTQQRTLAWWGSLFKPFVADGVAGFWNDMNEPAVFNTSTKTMPDNVQHRIDMPGFAKRTTDHREIHNVYGMLNSEGTYDGMLALRPNERPFVMTRASFAGGQRYAVTWTGDNSSTWNHLRMTMPQLMNLGLSGFSMAGADVGGFAGSPPADLLTKWIEVAAFQPIDRDHSAKGTRRHEVWVDGPAQEAIRRRFIEERYRLLPYLYTATEQTAQDGVPLMRPLFVEFPDATTDRHPIDLDAGGSEFLVGPDLLVAPNPSPEEIAPYEVHLPPGTWYDYWTGERFERASKTQARDLEQRDQLHPAQPLMITPTLEVLPVYVRGGSIVPTEPLTQSTEEMPQGPLTLRIYPALDKTTPCAGEVYTDDGHSFNYKRGEYARIGFTCALAQDGSLSITIAPQVGHFKPWWTDYKLEVFGWSPKKRTAVIGGDRRSLQSAGVAWTVSVPATPAGEAVQMQ